MALILIKVRIWNCFIIRICWLNVSVKQFPPPGAETHPVCLGKSQPERAEQREGQKSASEACERAAGWCLPVFQGPKFNCKAVILLIRNGQTNQLKWSVPKPLQKGRLVLNTSLTRSEWCDLNITSFYLQICRIKAVCFTQVPGSAGKREIQGKLFSRLLRSVFA